MDEATEHPDVDPVGEGGPEGQSAGVAAEDPEPDVAPEAEPQETPAETPVEGSEDSEPEVVSGAEPQETPAEAPAAPSEEDTGPLTLDELVAELADTGSTDTATEASDDGSGEVTPPDGALASELEIDGEAEEIEAAEVGPRPVVARLWARIPFWVLGACWVGFAGTLTYLLWPVSTDVFVKDPRYAYFVFGGAALVAAGLALGLTIWIIARVRAGKDGRSGIARTVWMRALGWTTGGVVLWWIGLIALDMHRAGLIR
jgi:hypothetical protein